MFKTITLELISVDSLKKSTSKDLLKKLEFEGKYKQLCFSPELEKLFLGLTFSPVKTADPFYKPDFYNLGATVANFLKKYSVDNLKMDNLSEIELSSKNLLDFQLGFSQAYWKYDKYKSPEKTVKPAKISLSADLKKIFTKADAKLLEALNQGLTLTRTLVSETPENVHPQNIGGIIKSEFKKYTNVTVKIFDKKQLESLGMNGILAVGRGSRYEPVLVHVVLKSKSKSAKKICLVGKGVTYDSGGLDIKVGGAMKGMKDDKGGAMTMFGTMKALAELNDSPYEVHWLSPFVENMPNSDSYKSDDIITTYSGQTVEIFNTDAEGRVILSDALAYATLLEPEYIIDTATLTGMCVLANNERFTGMMGNDQELLNNLMAKFVENGEFTVQNQLPESLRKDVEGDISDLINTANSATIGGRPQAGHITAGLFLSHFIDQTRFKNPKLKIKNPKAYSWIHLDIAGSVLNKGNNQLEFNGATGQSIRSLVDLIRSGE